jgi:5-oxoprolinase (ATP-hydrolysing) subunit A
LIAVAADVAEGGADDVLLPLLDAANICCGGHAGSADLSVATVRRCLELGVQVGAHPGYEDRDHFGRLEIALSPEEIELLLERQLKVITAVATPVFLKPHGALYHRCQSDPGVAAAAARVARRAGVALVGQPGIGLLAAAREAGVQGWREGYADRGYAPDGSLLPRESAGAILQPEAAAAQALALARSGSVDVICLHGDSPAAVEVAAAVRAALDAASIPTGPLGTS